MCPAWFSPSHAALHEKVFRHDNPIWEQIYPPNGFNCRCRVRTVSQARLETEGLTVDDSSGQLQEEMAWSGVDKRTGEAYQQPVTVWRGKDARGQDAVFRTDPGFNGNQGQLALWDRRSALPDCLPGQNFARPKGRCIQPIPGQSTWETMQRPHLRDLPDSAWRPMPTTLPRADSVEEALATTLAAVDLSGRSQRTIQTPIGPQIIHRDQFVHVARGAGGREQFAGLIIPTLTQPLEIWAVDYGDHMRLRHLALFRDQRDRPVMSVARENTDGSFWFWTFIPKKIGSLNNQRTGTLLWPK